MNRFSRVSQFGLLIVLMLTPWTSIQASCLMVLNRNVVTENPSELMDAFVERLNATVGREFNSLFQGSVQSEWGESANKGYRQQIRNGIANLNPAADSSKIIDLERFPEIPEGSVSVSHSSMAGGFLQNSRMKIGFDIEANSEVQVQTVYLASTPKEKRDFYQDLKSRPNIVIWVAKEAALKSLSALGVKKVSDIQISIEEVESSNPQGKFQWFRFSATVETLHLKAAGQVMMGKDHSLGAAWRVKRWFSF